jgi:hypothetical protein
MKTETTERGSSAFTATHWSIVLEAQQTDPQRAGAALESLCSRYWYPLYAFIRRRGHDPEEAKDLTQSFFLHLLILIRFQDEPNSGRVLAWQDHAGLIHSLLSVRN